MRKNISILMLTLILFVVITVPVFAKEEILERDGIVFSQENGNQVITVTGEENIKRFQESLGEKYDPNLIVIRRIINKSYNDEKNEMTEITPFFIFREYYIKNKRTSKGTDFGTILKSYNRPAGKVSINEGVNITTSFNADAGITADILESKLGFSVSSTDTFQIKWSGNYSYPIKILVHPIYEKIIGEVWDKDVKYDDFVGKFTVKRALGDDIRVYKR